MQFLYSCGSNGHYQLGDGTQQDRDELIKVLEIDDDHIKQIACGGNHTLVLLQSGVVLAVGDNTYGQCGLDNNKDDDYKDYNDYKDDKDDYNYIKTFTRIPGIWRLCSCGYEFSVLIDYNNDVYICGNGVKGELAMNKKQTLLTQIDYKFEYKIDCVKSCLDHTVVLLSNGDLYGWGNGRNGKLGDIKQIFNKPELIKINVKNVDLARDFTIFESDDGLQLIGKDNFGIKDDINMDNIKEFKTMWSSLHLIRDNYNKDDYNITSLGNNSHGQLLNTTLQFDLFQVGSEHGIISYNNIIKTWGWGEHGNCGSTFNINSNINTNYIYKLNVLKEFDENVVMIKGGCATTWVVTSNSESER